MKQKYAKQNQTVREKIEMEDQVAEQLRAYRNVRNVGNLALMENTVSGLYVILSPWIAPEKKDEFKKVKYAPLGTASFYNADDMDMINNYGGIGRKRRKVLEMTAKRENRRHFYLACDRRIEILMETFKMLGLGFEEQETATIHHDKKKVTGPASR